MSSILKHKGQKFILLQSIITISWPNCAIIIISLGLSGRHGLEPIGPAIDERVHKQPAGVVRPGCRSATGDLRQLHRGPA